MPGKLVALKVEADPETGWKDGPVTYSYHPHLMVKGKRVPNRATCTFMKGNQPDVVVLVAQSSTLVDGSPVLVEDDEQISPMKNKLIAKSDTNTVLYTT
ncbi:MAG: hypothetical protein KDA84_15295 [Planctomycetaceae bacterium]|nr:hypothetical protein [Planctomycetaceae bacterium]